MPMIPQAIMGGPPMMGGPPPGMGGPPPGMGAPTPGGLPPQGAQPPEVDPLEHLRMAIEHAQAALVSEPDDADSQLLSKLIAGLYQILAARQKEQEAALGMAPGMKFLTRG